jgi:alkanesulfonate monooxygenase SsuD/methylene tetrahydromethanopterin reductase-like flavin-dependent oxidoreductase (luciferase family)
MFPANPSLATRFWEATFHVEGGVRAAKHGSGLLLSRTMPRPPLPNGQFARIYIAQQPIVDAYLENLSPGVAPRISLSRTVYVARTREEAYADAEIGMRRYAAHVGERAGFTSGMSVGEIVAKSDFHIGSPDDVIESLRADTLLSVATDVTFQVHPVDESHTKTLRSFELVAKEVAPALGWQPGREREPSAAAPLLAGPRIAVTRQDRTG